jgi:N-acetylmuramoyl-L-alanine amidase
MIGCGRRARGAGRAGAGAGGGRAGAGALLAGLCLLGWSGLAGAAAAACVPAGFAVALDVGHDRARPGATSARGVPELDFNLALARTVLAALRAAGFGRSFLIGESGAPLLLRERSAAAARGGAEVLISLHHDSVQERYLEPWTFAGRVRDHTTHARGFALFVSAESRFFDASRALAGALGAALRAAGQRPSVHHAERIAGESRPVLDAANGVYRLDQLVVLRTAAMPAVLLEAGVIKHREEELVVASPAFRADVAEAILSAVRQACADGMPGAAAPRPQGRGAGGGGGRAAGAPSASSASRPARIAVGRGGQPRMWRSTGIAPATPPATA